ncbi:hypothetical protein EC973_009064 [Apophysomyces ossiformis]|uniref:SF4 helicase domain-containing protein n=1 Tax=Apophysomyces ossiformis TaxID=679940 RepID=A0A8H7EPU0_9FUNG|nr:hypothetical protein EC973_009064 [Apophysomyces ossiformis]
MLKLLVRSRYLIRPARTGFSRCQHERRVSTSISVVKHKPLKKREMPAQQHRENDVSKDLRAEIMDSLYHYQQQPIPTHKPNIILTNCPHCLKVRKKSFAAYIDLAKASYECASCKAKGSWNQFLRVLHNKLESATGAYEITHASNQMWSRSVTFSRPLEEIQNYAESLSLNAALLENLAKKHKIKPEIWKTYRVGVAEYASIDERLEATKESASMEVGAQCLTFPQTRLIFAPDKDEDNAKDNFHVDIARIKACELEDPAKLTVYDPPLHNEETLTGLFGYHVAREDSDTIILTRRELDAMAAYQETGIASVALPTMNYQLQQSVLPLLERFSNIYIWLDDDVEGQLSAERFAKRIGEARCYIVHTRRGEPGGPLNPHGALMAGHDLPSILKSAVQLKHDQIADFHDLREEVYREILNPEQIRGVQSQDLPALNRVLKGHRPGELTILTGPTGAGKTTIISQLSLDYCKSGVPTLWGSFEIQNKRLAKKMLYQFAGKDLSKWPKELDLWADKFEQLPLYFLKFFSSTAIKDVLDACTHAVYAYDVRHIILDNLQFMLSQQGKSSLDRWELQDEAVAELRRFATQQDVHVSLVVHPRKDSSEQLDINSVFGSAKVTQESDNVIIIQKNEELNIRYLDVKKNRFDGTLGSIPYKFMPESLKIRCYSELELANLQQKMQGKVPLDRPSYGSTQFKARSSERGGSTHVNSTQYSKQSSSWSNQKYGSKAAQYSRYSK